MAREHQVELLGELPLDIRVREQADGGRPTVVAEPEGPRARAFFDMARRTAARLAVGAGDRSHAFPTISIEDT
jgi:ATP-binding protein involved in chromosome partitioning